MIRIIRFLGLVMLLAFFKESNAQTAQYAYLVSFTDKNPTTFSLNAPQAYLSTRALDRRTKYNIAIDSTDLPIIDAYVDSVLNVTQGILHLTSKWMNSAVILVSDTSSLSSLSNISFVSSYKEIAYYATGLHLKGIPIVTDGKDNLTGNKVTDFDENYYGQAWTQIHLCEGEYMHDQSYRGENMLIAVMDEGFKGVNTAAAFDSLMQENRIYDMRNFVLKSDTVFTYNDHGTKVLSCMAALIPETHVGTAPKAMYALYVSEDGHSEQIIEESNLLAAAERADSIGADIITTSVGYNYFDNQDDSHTFAQLDGHTTVAAKALNIATKKGILTIASAGNEGQNAWQKILTPGDADSALTIGNVNSNGICSATSSYGPNAANILKPDVSAMGVNTAIVDQDGDITTASGTSVSTPVIAGLSACLMQAMPLKTPYEIRRMIAESCDSFSSPSFQRGYGIPDFRKILDPSSTSVGNVPGKSKSAFTLYPNPALQYIALKGEGKMSYSILDLQGRTLIQGVTTANKNISIAHLSKGIYLMKISNDTAVQAIRLTIE